jgi:hypothetical protein
VLFPISDFITVKAAMSERGRACLPRIPNFF